MSDRQFRIPDAVKAVIGISTAVVAAVMAYNTAVEGVEQTEDKINDFVDKIQDRKNKNTPPLPAE